MEFFRIFGGSSTVVPTALSGINDVGESGFTRLQTAVLRCEDDVVKSLIDGGAKLDDSGTHGRRPIFLLADFFGTGIPKKDSDEKRLTILNDLLEAGVDSAPFLKRSPGGFVFSDIEDNLCHIAIKKRDSRLLQLLLRHNVEAKSDKVGVNVVDGDGLSAIAKVAVRGNSEMVDVLLSLGGGDGSVSQEGRDRALNLTCRVLSKAGTDICGKWRVVESLIKGGANPRWVAKDGFSAAFALQEHNCERGVRINGLITPAEELPVERGVDDVVYLLSGAGYESKIDETPLSRAKDASDLVREPSATVAADGVARNVVGWGKDEVYVYDV